MTNREYVYFNANNQQLKELIVKTINASRPRGLGYLHYEERDYRVSDITEEELKEYMDTQSNVALHIDYFKGRAVKLMILYNPLYHIMSAFRIGKYDGHSSMNAFYRGLFENPKSRFKYKMINNLNINYETWSSKYPSVEDLLKSLKIDYYKEEDKK